jgi:hypothetical protein
MNADGTPLALWIEWEMPGGTGRAIIAPHWRAGGASSTGTGNELQVTNIFKYGA